VFKCVGPAHIGLQLPWAEVHDLAANLESHAERLRPVAETLLRSGIRFGIELIGTHVNDAPVGVALEELIDTERLPPGASGVIDARAFLKVLDEIGFDGPALVEPFSAEVRALAPEARVAAVAASLESVWP
jgi:sugar phosphate isomerase/epimerase